MSTLRNGERHLFAASSGACGVLLLGLLSQAPARAAWEFVPNVGIAAESADNPRLDAGAATTDSSSATNTLLVAGANVATFNERGSLIFEPTVRSYQYSDARDSDLEGEDWYFDSRGEYQWRTVTAGFYASLANERVLSAELLDIDRDNNPDTEDPITADTGRLAFLNEDRDALSASPYLSFRVSDRNSIRLEAARHDYSYSGGDRPFRTGFVDTRFSVGIDRNVDERNQVSAVIAAETYEADGTQNKTDNVLIEGEFTRPLSQIWTINLAAGVLRSELQFLNNNLQLTSRATTDYIMRLGLRKRAERSRVNIDFIRDVYPNGNGFSSLRREIMMYYDRELTQRVNATFGVMFNDTESLGEVNIEDNREYTRAEIGFEWALKPVLFLEAGYQYTAQDFTEDLIQQNTNSNSISIGLTYRGLSRR